MTADHAIDALTVGCPTCRAQVRAACYYAPQPGTWWPCDTHPARIEAARALLRERAERLDDLPTVEEMYGSAERRALRSVIDSIILPADDRTLRAIAALLMARQAMPLGFDELVAVFEHGARKHNGGAWGIAPGVAADDCADHLVNHAENVTAWPEGVDRETGRLDAAHASARGVMVAELVIREREAARKAGR